MAEKLDAFPADLRRGRKKLYPYDEWLDGSTWKLTVGEDFSAKPESVRASMQAEAKLRGGKLRCSVRDEGKTIFIQFLPGGK